MTERLSCDLFTHFATQILCQLETVLVAEWDQMVISKRNVGTRDFKRFKEILKRALSGF